MSWQPSGRKHHGRGEAIVWRRAPRGYGLERVGIRRAEPPGLLEKSIVEALALRAAR